MAPVRPEYGPTLGQLAGPRLRALPRAARIALAVLAVVVLALVAFVGRGESDPNVELVRRTPIAFNLIHAPALGEVATKPGELLRLETSPDRSDRQSYVVRPLRLAAYSGDTSGALLLVTSRELDALRRADPNFVYRGEGRARVNKVPGYQLLYSTVRDGKTVYGRKVFLVPDVVGAREGVVLSLLADRSPAVPNVAAVGGNGSLKAALRSFRFGTERP